MKNFTLSVIAALFLSACGNSASTSAETKVPDTATEAITVDSLTSELDAVEEEIDNNINALEDALNDL